MKTLPLDEIRRAVRGRYLTGGEVGEIAGVTTDTRLARPGELFVALTGERFDGHAFLPAAAEAGCLSAMVRLDPPVPCEVLDRFGGQAIGVDDTLGALGRLAAYHRLQVPATVVAVTGSNGKTTVKRMIHHILSRRLTGTCSPKSFNNAVGVPLTLLDVSPGDDYVVCEIGTSAPGEIAALARMTHPNIAVITSIGPTHLEGLGSIEGVAAEKASILHLLADGALAVVTADSEPLAPLVRASGVRTVRFGESDGAELRLTGYEGRGFTQRFQWNGRLWVDLPLPGRQNARNALAAIAVAGRFGIDREEAGAALADFDGAAMRLERIRCGPVTVLNDSYNANPSSVAAAAGVLAECEAARRVMILGDMRELGDQAERLHRQTGRRIAATGLDLLIGVGELGRLAAAEAAGRGPAVAEFDSVDAAAVELGDLLREGDLVLIKGSRGMAMERLVEPIRAAFAPPGAGPDRPKGNQR